MSFYLAVDTATEACSAAILLDGKVTGRFEVVDREHTRRLLPMIAGLVADGGRKLSQLDGIACGIGPGSFAGVRIGVGVVKGIALAQDLPVVGVSSLAMLAQRALRESGASQVLPVIDARMQEVYAGVYRVMADGRMRAAVPDRVCPASQVPRIEPGAWLGVGTGWGAYRAELRAAFGVGEIECDPVALPHAEEALRLALPEFEAGRGHSADTLVPAYLRDRVALTLAEQAGLRERRVKESI